MQLKLSKIHFPSELHSIETSFMQSRYVRVNNDFLKQSKCKNMYILATEINNEQVTKEQKRP